MSSPSHQQYLEQQRAAWAGPADDIRQQAEDRYNAVRSNRDLTPDAQRRRIAAHYFDAQSRMEQQRATDGADTAADLAAAKRQAYGLDDLTAGMSPAESAATLLSFRDAQARAAEAMTSPQAAQALLEQAEQSGDELLARAVANAALAQPFGTMREVADQFLASRPAKRAALDKITQLSQPTTVGVFGHMLVPPAELQGLTPGQLEQLRAEVSQ